LIERFRGLKTLSWHPGSGFNVILGGGDVGKTTILDAIALLFSPTSSTAISDIDYYARNEKSGFSIEAVVSIPLSSGINNQTKPSWPWTWSGTEAVPPSVDENAAVGEPVYKLRVRGTEDLELAYEIIQPDGNADNFPVTLRRAIGLVRLSGDDRNDRDLRLVQGSALDRLLSDKGLRSRLVSELAKSDVKSELTDKSKKALADLDKSFHLRSLPRGLDLSITGGQGLSVAALIGLTANCEGVQLPLACWGSGPRRIAALAIAEQNQGEAPITLVDEIERGLEPYRQRSLVEKLQTSKSQVFVTTHSPSAISAASDSSLWYVDHTGKIGCLHQTKLARHRKNDPEMFLARLSIVAEGITELGFVSTILGKAFPLPLQSYGIHISDGGGHESALGILEALAEGGLHFGGFVNEEGKHPTRWQKLDNALGKLLFRWKSGCTEECILAVIEEEQFESFLTHDDSHRTNMRLRTLANRLALQEKNFAAIKAKAGNGLRQLMVEAAKGSVPGTVKEEEKKEYKSHAGTWFKSAEGGRELAAKLFSLGIWPSLKPQLMPFCNAVRQALAMEDLEDITQ
jgi:putative ATP-dependent endonuclease of OLD family